MKNSMIKADLPSMKAFLHQPGESELRWMGDTRTHFLATGVHTAGAFCLVEERAKQGESVPLHRHAKDMESFYVLEGELMIFIEDQSGTKAGTGAFAHIPAGAIHGFRVTSETARYLILTTAHHGEFYRAITLPSLPGELPPLEGVSGDKIKKACMDYDCEFIGALPDA